MDVIEVDRQELAVRERVGIGRMQTCRAVARV